MCLFSLEVISAATNRRKQPHTLGPCQYVCQGLVFSVYNNKFYAIFRDIQLIMRIHYIKGLDDIIIVSPYGFTEEAREKTKTQYSQLLQLVNADIQTFFEQISHPRRSNP